MPTTVKCLVLAGCWSTMAMPLACQARWSQHPHVGKRAGHAMAHYPGNPTGYTVLYGGTSWGYGQFDDTWEFDGTTWYRRYPAHDPGPQYQHTMAYDGSEVILVTVSNPTETWAWDGRDWTLRASGQLPWSGRGGELVFHGARDALLYLTGREVWEWDRAAHRWTSIDASGTVDISSGIPVAYSPDVGEVVAFVSGATWTWRATTGWIMHVTTPAPPVCCDARSFYDPALGVVMFGGRSGTSPTAETWVWSFRSWSRLLPTVSPPARYSHAIAWDTSPGHAVLFGGDDGRILGDTWFWQNGTWSRVHYDADPLDHRSAAAAFDRHRDRLVVFGGNEPSLPNPVAETWEWDRTTWRLTATVGPAARHGHAMVYDETRREVLLFGGQDAVASLLGDTWVWDGSRWTNPVPPVSPPPRTRHSLAFDAARGRVVLFGGNDRSTWEWDGTTWSDRTPSAGPSPPGPVFSHSPFLAYDRVRQRVVFYGLGETWTWDGTQWTRSSVAAPSAYRFASLTYDEHRDRVVLFGGETRQGQRLDETWEWDGSAWTLLPIASAPGPRYPSQLTVYDPLRREVLVAGGLGSGVAYDDLWTYRTESPAGFRVTQTGCAAAGSQPAMLTPLPGHLPWVGSTFEFSASSFTGGVAAQLLLGGPITLDLSFLGMTRCVLGANPAAMLPPRSFANGVAAFALPIPGGAGLARGSVAVQVLALIPGANPLGAVLSDAAELTVGIR